MKPLAVGNNVAVDWATADALIWFFSGQSEADAGMRSVQGGFEDTLRRRAMCKGTNKLGHVERHENVDVWIGPCLQVHEARASAFRFDLPIDHDEAIASLLVAQVERQIGRRTSGEREGILARLERLEHRDRTCIAHQFGDDLWLCDGTVWPAQQAVRDHRWGASLALLCTTAPIVRVTERANTRREKRGAVPVDARRAVAELLARTLSDAAAAELVGQMAAEAEGLILRALEKYERVREAR